MESQTGEQKLRNAENVIIFDKVRVPVESTDQGAESPTSDKIGSTPTRRGRNRGKLNKKDALGILRSVVREVQETGLNVAVVNLPNGSFGIVIKGAWSCVRCSEFFAGTPALGNVCEACRGK